MKKENKLSEAIKLPPELLIRAMEISPGNSDYGLAVCYLEGDHAPKDIQKAEEHMTRAASGGLFKAMDMLGVWYRDGRIGTGPNPSEAIKWFIKGSEKLGISKYHLAQCHQKGFGVPRNDTEAVRLFAEAAQEGLGLAQYELAHCFLNGRGVLPDTKRAIELFEMAANNGIRKAKFLLRSVGESREPTNTEGDGGKPASRLSVNALLGQFAGDADPRKEIITKGLRELYSNKSENGGFAIFSIAKRKNVYVQVSYFPSAAWMRVEAVSNTYLSSKEQISSAQEDCLRKIGWKPPSEDETENHFVDIDVSSESDLDRLADYIILTLKEVYLLKESETLRVEIGE